MNNTSKPQDSFDRQLVIYQKMAISLCYPGLVGAVSGIFASFASSNSSYQFTFAIERFFFLYFKEHAIGDNYAYGTAIACLIAVAIAGLFIYLALEAAKGKRWPLYLGIGLYGADLIYLCFLLSPALYGTMDLTTWIVQLVMHIAFLALFVASLFIYAKLVRLQRKNPRN
jgi:hypothetical protein